VSCRATESGLPWFGRSPGAQISLVARSGENRFHGVAYDDFSNDALDANDFFNNVNHIKKQPLRYNNFGEIFSRLIQLPKKVFGPPGYDVQDHTFFFSYERQRFLPPRGAVLSVVPSLAVRRLSMTDHSQRLLFELFVIFASDEFCRGTEVIRLRFVRKT
jgi:hypothetical protein